MMLAFILIVIAAVAAVGAQQPVFKVQAELVRIDVLVHRNGTPLVGLNAGDFLVEDNGVPQRVSLLIDTRPARISTILDVSGSMTPEKLTNATAAIRAVSGTQREGDRHTLYAFAGEVRMISLPQAPDTTLHDSIVRALRESSGLRTSVFDALFAAIVHGDDEPGPKMAVVLTDGRNNTSWLTAQAAIDAAIRHETVIYPVAVVTDSPRVAGEPPMARDDLQLLQIVAERTGGRLIHANRSRDLGAVFEAIVREYRQRYILSFTPEGVEKRDGWHRLEVRLRNRPGRVHARSGYWSR
jgi:Ca-activated chloride channel homolog